MSALWTGYPVTSADFNYCENGRLITHVILNQVDTDDGHSGLFALLECRVSLA